MIAAIALAGGIVGLVLLAARPRPAAAPAETRPGAVPVAAPSESY